MRQQKCFCSNRTHESRRNTNPHAGADAFTISNASSVLNDGAEGSYGLDGG